MQSIPLEEKRKTASRLTIDRFVLTSTAAKRSILAQSLAPLDAMIQSEGDLATWKQLWLSPALRICCGRQVPAQAHLTRPLGGEERN